MPLPINPIAITRPSPVVGNRSPYPTVVIVLAAHHSTASAATKPTTPSDAATVATTRPRAKAPPRRPIMLSANTTRIARRGRRKGSTSVTMSSQLDRRKRSRCSAWTNR
jgi:hypothetical protein